MTRIKFESILCILLLLSSAPSCKSSKCVIWSHEVDDAVENYKKLKPSLAEPVAVYGA